MSLRVRMLAAEWELLGRAIGEPVDRRLLDEAAARGRSLLADGRGAPSTSAGAAPLARLRTQVVLRAAAASAYRHRLVTERHRLAVAEHEERRSYEDGLALDRDLVPPLKLRAKALRAEIRRLEAEARARGLDPDTIEPRVEWAETLAVDTYVPPRYTTDADRKRATLEFFRRLG